MLRKIAFSLPIVLLIAKVIAVVMRGPSPLVRDAGQYWELGGLVAQGDWLLMEERVAFRTPGYPWFLGLMQAVFSEPLFATVCVQAALWIATVGLTAVMAVQLSDDRRAGWIVLGIGAVMISSVTYVTAILSETLFVFAMMLHLWCVTRFTRHPDIIGGVLIGLTLALAILIRPIAMLVWIADTIYLIASWFWIRDRTSPNLCLHRGSISVALSVVTTLACVSPWLARNHAMFGKVMMTEFVGRNIWIVTFQDGSGAGLDLPDSENAEQLERQLGNDGWASIQVADGWRKTWTVSEALTDSGMDDPAADRLMKRIAFDAISTSPTPFAKKTFRRLINFWRTCATELPPQVADLRPVDNLAEASFDGQTIWGVKVAPVDTVLHYRWSNWLAGNSFLLVATVAGTMLLIWRRTTRPVGLWLGALLCYFSTVTAVLEIPDYRYRMIVEPIMLLVFALSITAVLFSQPSPTKANSHA